MAEAPIVGQIGSTKVRLADWLPPDERYQRRYVPVDPEGGVISEEPGLHADSKVRLWVIRSWSGGEGEDLWRRDEHRYRKSDGVTLVDIGEGLQLRRLSEITQDNTGSADFRDGGRFGLGQGKLWTADDGAAYAWDRTNERWGPAVSTGAGTSNATSIADGDDTWLYSGHEDGTIRRWKSGSSETHYGTGTGDDFTYAPVLRSWEGRLYALDGDDLYEIDKSAANTRTLVGDPAQGSSDDFLTNTPWSYNRMSTSDKGPIWLQRLDNGQSFVWQYNVKLDVQEIIAKLSVDFAYPYSIYYAQGWVFVGFRYANAHDQEGRASLFFARGAQRGVVGPFRNPSGVSASKPVLIAGQIGDDLIVYFDRFIWAYNYSDAGIREVAQNDLFGSPPEDAITFGQDIFTAPYNNLEVERYLADEYSPSGALWTGRFDFDYPGLLKLMTNVGVVTDPLPATTSISMAVGVDGAAPFGLPLAHNQTGDRRFTWVASNAAGGGSDFTGYQFELEIRPSTSDPSVTPTIREIWAMVTGVAHRIEWILAVDCTKFSHKDIDDLNALRGQTRTFTDPWQNRGSDGADEFVVTVEDVVTPERLTSETPEQVHALLRLRARDLVDSVGSS